MRRRLEVREKTRLTMLAGAELKVTDSVEEVIKACHTLFSPRAV
jgi:uncharacterized protein YlzI (FlbEa/FlbD family)